LRKELKYIKKVNLNKIFRKFLFNLISKINIIINMLKSNLCLKTNLNDKGMIRVYLKRTIINFYF